MREKWISILVAVALCGLMLAVAGCGGDGGTTTTTTVAIATETDGMDTEATDTVTTETETDEMETETTGIPDPSSFATSENCQEFAALATSFAAAMGGTAGDETEEAAEALQNFAAEAPEEIRDDFEVLADAYSTIAEALEGVDLTSGETPSPEVLERLQAAASAINTTEVQEASENITAWTQENCTTG